MPLRSFMFSAEADKWKTEAEKEAPKRGVQYFEDRGGVAAERETVGRKKKMDFPLLADYNK